MEREDEGEEEVPEEKTELQLKVEAIAKEFEALRKPIALRKELWSAELAKVDSVGEALAEPLRAQRETAVDAAAQVEAMLGLSLASVKTRARLDVVLANLHELDKSLHALALEEVREMEKARLALEPPEDEE